MAERTPTQNLNLIIDYLNWLMCEPTVLELMSTERRKDLFSTVNTFIKQYDKLVTDYNKLRTFDENLKRLESGLAVARMIR